MKGMCITSIPCKTKMTKMAPPNSHFLEDMNFEKYADMVMKMPLLFVLKDSNHLNATGKTFKDFFIRTMKKNNIKYDSLEKP